MIYLGKFFTIAIVCFFILSCAVGPDFHHPPLTPTNQYTKGPLVTQTVTSVGPGGEKQQLLPGADIPAKWWGLFLSPELDCLIKRGIENSPNLSAAKAALRRSEENLRASFGSLLLPSLDAAGLAQRQRFSGSTFGSQGGSTIFNLYQATIQASYTLDVFGGLRRQVEATGALVDFQTYEVLAAYQLLTTNIVVTAITQASLREQIKATQQLIDAQQNQLDILKRQFELGGISIVDVLSQQTLLAQTRASLPPLEQNLVEARNYLSVLVGELPSESEMPVFSLDKLELPKAVPIGIPSLLVRKRPDILASEALLHEASAKVGVATANLLPQFNITGYYGSQSNQISDLFSAQSLIWNLQGQMTQAIFHGGALLAERRAAIATFDQVKAQYKEVVLKAFQEVANRLSAIEIDARELKAQTQAQLSAQQSLTIAQQQFKLGAANYLFILTAERQYQSARIDRIQAQARRLIDTALLFHALGGGWWNEDIILD